MPLERRFERCRQCHKRGPATDRAPRSAPEGYKKDGEWVRRCAVIDTGGALLAREDDRAVSREIPARRRPSHLNPPGAEVPTGEEGDGRLPLNGARRIKLC
jgi:hypothetical protein